MAGFDFDARRGTEVGGATVDPMAASISTTVSKDSSGTCLLLVCALSLVRAVITGEIQPHEQPFQLVLLRVANPENFALSRDLRSRDLGTTEASPVQ